MSKRFVCDTHLMHSISSVFQNQPLGPNMMKPGPTMLQSLPPPTTFSVPAQGPPPSLLQAQLSAASLTPLLHNPPQPLLPQPPPKGTSTPHGHSQSDGSRKSDENLCFSPCRVCVFGRFTPAPSAHDTSAPAGEARGPLSSLPQSQWPTGAHPEEGWPQVVFCKMLRLCWREVSLH